MKRSWVTVLLVTVLSFAPFDPGRGQTPPGAVPFEIEVIPAAPARSRPIMAWEKDGTLYLAANDLAAALRLDKFWRADLGRLILSGTSHRITVIEGTDVAVIDDGRLLHLPGPVFLWEGQLLLPLDLFVDAGGEPLPWVEDSLVFSRSERTLRIGKEATSVVGGRVHIDDSGWTLEIVASGRLHMEVRQEAGPELVILLAGVTVDPELHPLPAGEPRWLPWVLGFRCETPAGGLELHLLPGPSARGYRVAAPDSNRVMVSLGADALALSPFSGRALTELRRVVLDPGHGGSDAGAVVKGGKEAKLTWALAGYLKERLEAEGVDVVLTRAEGQDPSPEARAETANQHAADLLLSLHIHARAGEPVAYLTAGVAAGGGASSLDDLGFRHYETDHASHESESRAIAEAILQSVIAAGSHPALSRGIEMESIPELAGARMPALLLEMGTDPKGGWSEDRLRLVAESIASGLGMARGLH